MEWKLNLEMLACKTEYNINRIINSKQGISALNYQSL